MLTLTRQTCLILTLHSYHLLKFLLTAVSTPLNTEALQAYSMAVIKDVFIKDIGQDQWATQLRRSARVPPTPPPRPPSTGHFAPNVPMPPPRVSFVPGPAKGKGKFAKGMKGGKSAGKGMDKGKKGSKDIPMDSKGVGKGSAAKDRINMEDMDPVEKDKMFRKKIKNLRGLVNRNIRDHPELADLLPVELDTEMLPNRDRSPSHYRGQRSPPHSRSPSRTRARSRSRAPEAGTIVATASNLSKEEEEALQIIEFVKMVKPWASVTIPSSSAFPDAKEATRVAYGYSNALIQWGSTETVTREKLIAMGTSMLNMATQ